MVVAMVMVMVMVMVMLMVVVVVMVMVTVMMTMTMPAQPSLAFHRICLFGRPRSICAVSAPWCVHSLMVALPLLPVLATQLRRVPGARVPL